MRPTTVILGDDHDIVCDGLLAILESEPDIRVLAAVSDGYAALEQIRELSPWLAVLDLAMPGMTGIEVARRVREEALGTATMLLSMHKDPAVVRIAIEAGVRGYMVKDGGGQPLVEAIRRVAAGELYLCPRVAALVDAEADPPRERAPAELNAREREVLCLLAEGLSSKEMARRLLVSKRTVDWYRATIMRKLDVHTVPGLVMYALKHQLVAIA